MLKIYFKLNIKHINFEVDVLLHLNDLNHDSSSSKKSMFIKSPL